MAVQPVAVLTQHNDNGRTGANLQETLLTTSNVNVSQFGKIFEHQVQGQIYAQPLYVPFVQIAGKGVHHTVIVATMDNWLYAFDADDADGSNSQPLWARQIHDNPVPAHIFKDGYKDVLGNIGILSTPVIDAQLGNSVANPSSGTIYVLLATWNPAQFPVHTQSVFKQLLYAINLSDGQLRPASPGQSNPIEIGGTIPGGGYTEATSGALDGTTVIKTGGAAKVDVTVNGKLIRVTDSDAGKVLFSPMQQMQRPALLLNQGVLCCAFGSHGDFDPYHGWVFAYDAGTLHQRGVFCTTPNGAKSGIWQAGEGLVADAAGNVYLGTGNGDSKQKPGSGPDLGESYVRLRVNAGSLALTGWVTIQQDATNPLGKDEDLGAASPTLLPDGRLVGGGKDGNFYLLDPAQMDTTGSQVCVIQQFLASKGPGSRASVFVGGKEISTHHIHGSPVVYDSPQNGILVYVWGENDILRAYRYDPTAHNFPGQPNQRNQVGTPAARGVTFASNDVKDRSGMPGGMLSVSANGKVPGTAILWASFPPFRDANKQFVDGELIAYDAAQFDDSQPNGQKRLIALWRSHQNPRDDDYGNFAKFCCPTIAHGKVYQATFSNRLRVYGLRKVPDGGYQFAFGSGTGLTLNGSARSDDGPVRLAGRHPFQSGSMFCTQPVDVTRFTTAFRFLLEHAEADGLTFCIQREGPHALGGPGGGLGYGPDPTDPLDPGFRITRSVAVKFDLFDNPTNQPRSSTGLYQNGDTPSGGPTEVFLEPLGINLRSGHFFRTTITYDGTTLSVAIRDEQTVASITRQFVVDIPGVIGGPTAHVGFTAGTGGLMAEHDILSWEFTESFP